MARQIPEPDFYTLAEVAERWGRSEDVLLRLGGEGKVKYGYYSNHPILAELRFIPSSGRPFRYPLFHILPEEIEAFGWSSTTAIISGLFYLDKYKIMSIIHDNETQPLGIVRFYDEIRAFIEPNGPTIKSLPPGTNLVANAHKIHKSELVIPTSEIHRIEYQHEVAEKANAEDVLGTTERETMQAIIAAFADVLAERSPQYLHGKNPNALQIAKLLDPRIPNRTDEGIRKTIGNAIKAGLTVKP